MSAMIDPAHELFSSQWRAETLQMVNWGGFHGVNTVTLATNATLLSGPSGTGKSTLLDAYLALTMPSDTPFNGASNDAISGRARSAGQRNLLSYLRGKTDDARESGTGDLREHILRGQDANTWGAIAMTFIDDMGTRFTIARLYFVPRGAAKSSDISMKMVTFNGFLDLKEMEPLAQRRFDKRDLVARFSGIEVADTYARFAQILYTRLGIGAHGDGSKALRLLARIQSGQQVRTVDDLYKSMVLETPGTYAAADRAIEHFSDLEAAYDAMLTESEKEKVLNRLPDLHADLTSAQAAIDLIDTFGIYREGDTPFLRWALAAERDLLDEAEMRNCAERGKAREALSVADENERRLEGLLTNIQSERDAAGGSMITRLEEEINRLTGVRADAEEARTMFDTRTLPLGIVVTSQQEFISAQDTARSFLHDFDRRLEDLHEKQKNLNGKSYPVLHEHRELSEERESLSGRDGLVPKPMHEARIRIAEAAGISPEDLPFVAELVDIAPEHQEWRTATESALHGIARVLLVDESQLAHVSRSIDPVRLGVRINFEGVPLARHREVVGDSQKVSGKLVYRASPFSHWVADRVSAEGTDALCVNHVEDLNGPGRRITKSGQIRTGRSGAHGEYRTPHIIGFSNTERIAAINARLAELETKIREHDSLASDISRQVGHLHACKGAHEYVLATPWKAIDVEGITNQIKSLTGQRQEIVDSSDKLATLQREEQRTRTELAGASKQKYTAEIQHDTLAKAYSDIVDRKDNVVNEIDRMDREQSVVLTDTQVVYLTAEFGKVGDVSDLERFQSNVDRLSSRLKDQSKEEQQKFRRLSESLVAIFTNYQDRWPNPNLGTGLLSYDGYLEILDEIVSTGLHERRQEWSRRLAEWSGQDLVPLAGAFETSIGEIEQRLLPVNAILAGLPFGAQRNRLKIDLRRLRREDLGKFRRELNLLSSGSTMDLPDKEIEERFKRLRRFINSIRPTDKAGRPTQRDYFLDVRKHVEITAVALDQNGAERSTYASLGGKSGGETQELVAFIVGAALRFQLGDEFATRPRFAPVFLDEGFVKSDSEFAGRAVTAWQGLGFQLIVGAPLDKVTALEPYMDKVLTITKSTRGYSHISELTSPS